MDILHDSKNGATLDHLHDEIFKLAQQNPAVVKELGLPNDLRGIKKEIVTKWCDLQAAYPAQPVSDINFLGHILHKKPLGKIVEEKVNLSGLPPDLQAQLKEPAVEKIITQGICKGQKDDVIAGKIFAKLPKNMRTGENRDAIESYVQTTKNNMFVNFGFDKAVEVIFGIEGGLNNNKHDRGGLTNFGIAQNSHPDIDVTNITRDEAKEIYKKEYWDASGCDKIPWPMNLLVFDTAVNSGPAKAKALLAASKGKPAVFLKLREAFYKQRVIAKPDQKIFYNGWINRLKHLAQKIGVPYE